jgi:hypothetical protein
MKLSSAVKDISLRKGAVFGIEIEMEGKGLPLRVDDSYWECKRDGSLRGESGEFVIKKPEVYSLTMKKVKHLSDTLEHYQIKPVFSFRTSTHVHLNVSDMELNNILNLIYLYYLLEGCFMHFSSEERRGNRFCLRLKDADGFIPLLISVFKNNGRYIGQLPENELKYASLNIAPLSTYGSLEFRSLYGTLDSKIIASWLLAIENLRTIATEYSSLIDIYNSVKEDGGFNSLFNKVFSHDVDGFSYEDMEREFRINLSLSISIPFELNDSCKMGSKKVEDSDEEKAYVPVNRARIIAPGSIVINGYEYSSIFIESCIARELSGLPLVYPDDEEFMDEEHVLAFNNSIRIMTVDRVNRGRFVDRAPVGQNPNMMIMDDLLLNELRARP